MQAPYICYGLQPWKAVYLEKNRLRGYWPSGGIIFMCVQVVADYPFIPCPPASNQNLSMKLLTFTLLLQHE